MKIKHTALVLKSLEKTVGCKVDIEPRYGHVGQILFPNGKRFYFKNCSIDVNGHAASAIAKDKGYTRFFMEKMGYKMPRGEIFFSDYWCKVNQAGNDINAAVKFAKSLGYPLIVKPNSKSRGRGVFKVQNETDLKMSLKTIFRTDDIAVVEEFVAGDDYRLVIFDGTLAAAYRRTPLAVVGNGSDDIRKLLFMKKMELANAGRAVSIRASDRRIMLRLKSFYGVDYKYVPKRGERMVLLENANMSSGGDATEVMDIINAKYKDLAVRLADDMGLKFAGVDFILAGDISSGIAEPTFIEINSSPSLAHYQTISKEAESNVLNLYRRILLKLKNS